MSKSTKIIAIVGGILIIVAAIYGGKTILTVYTGGEKGAPRQKLTAEDQKLLDCGQNGWICARDAKGNVIMDKKTKRCKPVENGKQKCAQLVAKKCKDAAYKKANPTKCKKAEQAAAKAAKDDDDEGDE